MRRLIIFLAMMCVLAVVAAAQLSVPASVKLGSTGQEKSNPDEGKLVYAQTSFTMRNEGAGALTNIVISSSAASKYNVTFEPSTINSLDSGALKTISVRALVPADLDTFFPGRSNPQDERDNDIGYILFTADPNTSLQSNLLMQAENNLEFDKIYITVGDDRDSYKDREDVDDIKPGDRISVEVRVSNEYSSRDDVDFDDVEVFVESDDLDADEDLDFGDIDAGDKATEDYSFRVDEDVDDDTYVVTFLLTGDDDYGSTQGELWTIEFDVEKEDEDIAIKSAELSQQVIKCNRETTLNMKLENIGDDDSNDVVLLVESPQLGTKIKYTDIDLDEGDDYYKSVSLTIADDVLPGTYTFHIKTFFDYDDYEDNDINNEETVQLIVQECVETIVCYSCVDGRLASKEYERITCPSGESPTMPVCAPEEAVRVVIHPAMTPGAVTFVTEKPAEDLTYIVVLAVAWIVGIVVLVMLISHLVKRR